MNDFKQKTLKYLLILGAIYLFINLVGYLTPFHLQDIKHFLNIDDTQKVFTLTRIITRIITGIIFGIILLFDCRKELENRYLIPILGACMPVIGTILYFIEKLAISKTQNHEI